MTSLEVANLAFESWCRELAQKYMANPATEQNPARLKFPSKAQMERFLELVPECMTVWLVVYHEIEPVGVFTEEEKQHLIRVFGTN